MDPKNPEISVASAFASCLIEVTIPPSRLGFFERHVSRFGWSAVSPSRPALSQSAACSGGQGKRAAARSHAQPPLRGEHGEHWTLMAVARGATLDQAEGVQTSASASHNPYRAREAEPGSPSKSVTTTLSISVILLTFSVFMSDDLAARLSS